MTIPPGPPWPTPVSTAAWILRPGPFSQRMRARYGDAFSFRLAKEGYWCVFSHPDAIKQIFTAKDDVLHGGEGSVILRPLVGANSLLMLDEDRHMRERKMLLPPFHGERVKRYAGLIEEIAEQEIDGWPAGETIQLRKPMQRLTLEVIMRAVFGLEDAERLGELRPLLTRLLETTTSPRGMAAQVLLGADGVEKWGVFRSLIEPVDEILFDEIASRRRAEDRHERDDVLSMLIDTDLSDKDLRDQLMTMLIAGHETTATSLSWAVERLVRHPGEWERIRDDEDYADAVAKETLRLRPVLPIASPRKVVKPIEIGGYELLPGVVAIASIYLVHRREDVYPEPHRFKPERWLGTKPGTYTWFPFGGGTRRCLGATLAMFEMKVVLKVMAERLEIHAARPEREPSARRAITLAPGRGAEVVVSPRPVLAHDRRDDHQEREQADEVDVGAGLVVLGQQGEHEPVDGEDRERQREGGEQPVGGLAPEAEEEQRQDEEAERGGAAEHVGHRRSASQISP